MMSFYMIVKCIARNSIFLRLILLEQEYCYQSCMESFSNTGIVLCLKASDALSLDLSLALTLAQQRQSVVKNRTMASTNKLLYNSILRFYLPTTGWKGVVVVGVHQLFLHLSRIRSPCRILTTLYGVCACPIVA